MRLSLVFLCVLAAVTSTPVTDDDAHQDVHQVGTFSEIRKAGSALATAERKFGRGDSQSSLICAALCARTFNQKIKRELPNYDQNAVAIGKEIDADKLNKLCPIHDTAYSCINACPSSETKTLLTQPFTLTQFVCHDSVIKSKAQCINEAIRSSQSTCSSQCGAYERKYENYQRTGPKVLEGLTDMMKQTCLLTGCNINCAKEAITRNCGQQAQTDMNTLGKKSVVLLKSAVEMVGAGSIYPSAECDPVGA